MTKTDKRIVIGAGIVGLIIAWWFKRNASGSGADQFFPVPSQLSAPSTNVPWWLTYNNQPNYQGVTPNLPLALPQLNVPNSNTGSSTCAACNWWI